MDIGFRIRLSALALSENGDAKNWYRGIIFSRVKYYLKLADSIAQLKIAILIT